MSEVTQEGLLGFVIVDKRGNGGFKWAWSRAGADTLLANATDLDPEYRPYTVVPVYSEARAEKAEAEGERLREAGRRLYTFLGGVCLLLGYNPKTGGRPAASYNLPNISDIPEIFGRELDDAS